MGRLSRNILALLLAAALPVVLSACGSGGGADLLPGKTASEINSNLDQVQQLVAEEECTGAQEAALEVSAEVEELGGVDPKLKAALLEGAERLEAVVLTCSEEETEPTETTEEEEPDFEEEEEGEEKKEKKEKSKPSKETGPPSEPPEPPGHEEEKGKGEGPSSEEGETPSGGVGPGLEVEGE